MARSEYVESPRSSRRSRNNSHSIPPPAPEVDWSQPVDEEPHSPPRQTRRTTVRRTTILRDPAPPPWDHEDEEIPPRTPESRTSSSSYHPSHPFGHPSEHRRDRSTPSRSVASSRTSVHTVQPPRSSMNRQSDYRRPTVSVRDGSSAAGYEDDRLRDRKRSQSRPRSQIVTASLSQRTSRTFDPPSVSQSDSAGEDTETSYESHEDEDRAPRSHAERRLIPVSRDGRSRSRYGAAGRSDSRYRRPGDSARPVQEDFDDAESRHTPSLHEDPPPRTLLRSRSRPRAQSRSRSRPASVRRIQHRQPEDHVYDREENIDDDASAEESPAHDLRDRFERPTRSHKNRHSRTREHRRAKSEMHVKRSPPSKRYVSSMTVSGIAPGSSRRVRSSPKRYYETEVLEVEKRVRQHPPSASVRRSNTVHGSVAASQHQSVSSSTKRPSSTFLERLLGPPLPKHRHHAPEKPKKLVECLICMDDLEPRKTVKLKCGHRMCNPCLKRSFKLSITDSQHMPPKCCTKDDIPLKYVERLFSNDFKKTWNKKYREFSNRSRIYCPNRKHCNEYIRSEDIRKHDDGKQYWKCGKCHTKVCIQCNAKFHRGRDCPNDEETAKFVAQAKDEGWQRCYRCKAVVELREGCNHMTCRCGAQFCMVCGARWRTCECAWFNYDTVESDRLQHMQVPREPFGSRSAADVPPSPQRDARSGAITGHRSQSRSYEEEMRARQIQEESDAAYARRLQAFHDYGDEGEVDFVGGFGDTHGIGNAAGHFMNEDFRPRPRNIMVPQPPPPHAPAIPLEPSVFERPQAGDYIRGVNRARGVRAGSLNRLADRFNPENRQSPVHRPPALPTSQTMPLVMTPAVGSALASGPTALPMRRHTGGGDMYMEDNRPRTAGTRSVERVTMSGRTKRPVYYDEPEVMHTSEGAAYRDEPRASAMAGLTDGLKGHSRVDEWREYVSPGKPIGPV